MMMPYVILVISTALFFFYLQTACERVLRREFSHPYFREIAQAIQLEFPRLREGVGANASLQYSETRLTLKCDFIALKYLLKNSDLSHRHLSRGEKGLMLYFRFLLFSMSIQHALKLGENNTVVKLTFILQFFANVLGERVSVNSLDNALPDLQS
jgi:hypothetical protein